MFRTKCKEHDHSSFYQFLQMEHSQKNTDCYFFYYSTCRKGDSCPFRHEPSALGCETMCSYWQQGNCLNEHCNFRHMELKKNRKSIPCYWETQPGGCRKPHCSFLHKNARTITGEPINPVKSSDITSKSLNQEWLNRTEDTKYDGCSTESDQGRGSSEAGSFIGSPAVDPLIVKFEEESDNESIASPAKPQPVKRVSYCKTYEEIRLEEIQAESAAYYSYEADDYRADVGGGKASKTTPATATDTTSATSATTATTATTATSVASANKRIALYAAAKPGKRHECPDFKVLTLEEIRQRKKLKQRNSEEEDILRNAVKAYDGLKATNGASTRPLKRRRIETLDEGATGKTKTKKEEEEVMVEEEEEEEAEEAEEVMVEEETATAESRPVETMKRKVRVPPVRLKRSIRRFAEQSQEEDLSNASRKKEVEVRLCDSSTDEASRLGELEEKTEEKSNADTDGKSGQVYCDSLLNITEDEYLALDTASDDILKDIDAILKEKTPV